MKHIKLKNTVCRALGHPGVTHLTARNYTTLLLNATMSCIYSYPQRNGTGAQTTWPMLLYRTKPVSTFYSRSHTRMVHPSVFSDDITSTISPFLDPTGALFSLFNLAIENEWLKPISTFLEAIHTDCNDITPEACHSRHNFPRRLAKEPDLVVMLMKLCVHIQMAGCKHLFFHFVKFTTWPAHST